MLNHKSTFLKSSILPALMILALIYLRAQHGFLLFHTLAELFSIFVGTLMLVIVLNTQNFIRNDFLIYLGIGYFSIAVLDSFHTFTVKGMPFFGITTATITIHFWIYTRFLEALLLISSPLFLTRKLNIKYMLISSFFIVSIIIWLSFNFTAPEFINPNGLTPLKIYSEYLIITLLISSLIIFFKKRSLLTKKVIYFLYASLITTIIAETCFTFYINFSGITFVIGHIFKFLSFWMIYQAIVQTTLKEPFTLLTKNANTYDAIPHPAILVDNNGDISQANQAALKASKKSLIEIIHQPIHNIFHPNDVQQNHCEICIAIAQHQIISNKEVYYPQSNEWFLLTLTPINALDSTSSMVQTLTDISQQKLQETELIAHKNNLELTVSTRTSELQTSLETLTQTQNQLVESQKMAALGELVAGVAHEINTPIGVGVTATSHLAEETDKLDRLFENKTLSSNNLKAYLLGAKTSSTLLLSNLNRASDLIHSFKQVAVDQTSEQNRQFKIKEYIHEILSSLYPKLKKANVEICVECEKEFIIECSPSALAQIITNLVINAITHGFESCTQGKIKIEIIQEEGMVKLLFQDFGKGISNEHLKKLFDPFFTTKRGQGGSGLGLNIVYNLVTQSLKGRISCDSELGSGTRFNILFPSKIL
ncbi:MASE3 domain-containing protein [Pseudoalteromonas denitrificans]|uniref:histidine kinase n=1 Tax=Pseudoalteromonas denitrificans DSM 6059 TaxID=1123010 RepID=A0A1I1IY15_9GAMM|nr:MASE3 domain-containing protein [Pseudoalteromonas denitrificans]SFC38110.1 Histidine kinase-, DNA gyrase B-, and HSP90-like ATPase [Pseudoalteromonas denitrificans DSM 6059]